MIVTNVDQVGRRLHSSHFLFGEVSMEKSRDPFWAFVII